MAEAVFERFAREVAAVGRVRPARKLTAASEADLKKKKKSLHAAEQNWPYVAVERTALRRRQPRVDSKRLVFIDETSVATNITRANNLCRDAAASPAGRVPSVRTIGIASESQGPRSGRMRIPTAASGGNGSMLANELDYVPVPQNIVQLFEATWARYQDTGWSARVDRRECCATPIQAQPREWSIAASNPIISVRTQSATDRAVT